MITPGTISKQLPLLLSLVFVTIIERDNAFVTGKPTTITYDLVEDVDGMPVLGRGYSLTTNSFLSSCFDVNGTTVEDSYHYDCKFYDLIFVFLFSCTIDDHC